MSARSESRDASELLVSFEAHHFAIGEKRLPTCNQRRFDALANPVVPQLQLIATVVIVEDVEVIFAVGRCDRTFVIQIAQSVIESFELTVCK